MKFSKAFGRIDHNVLPCSRTSCLTEYRGQRFGQVYSAEKHPRAGVPQGTKLGPFWIMVDDPKLSNGRAKFVDRSTTSVVLYKVWHNTLPALPTLQPTLRILTLRIRDHNLRHNGCFFVPVCKTDLYHDLKL